MNKLFKGWILMIALSGSSSIAFADDRRCLSKSSDELTLLVEFEKSKVMLGEKFPMRVLIKNIGESMLQVPALMESEDYWLRFEISDSHGKKIRFTGPEDNKMYRESTVSLLPGYLFGVEIDDLSKFYKMTKPGTYLVQAVYGRSPVGECKMGSVRSLVKKVTVH